MKYRNQIDCHNTSGDNLSQKICLNINFQKVDSILNSRIVSYVHHQTDSNTKSNIIQHHKEWVLYRRKKAEEQSEGLNGHMVGIYYLSTMIKLTELRTEELDFYLNN